MGLKGGKMNNDKELEEIMNLACRDFKKDKIRNGLKKNKYTKNVLIETLNEYYDLLKKNDYSTLSKEDLKLLIEVLEEELKLYDGLF